MSNNFQDPNDRWETSQPKVSNTIRDPNSRWDNLDFRDPNDRALNPRVSKPTSSEVVFTHYCIIRQDLPRGVLAAQMIHAAGESSPGTLPKGTKAVALAATDEAHLLEIEKMLSDLKIPHQAIREPSPPWNGQIMAIGLCPIYDRDLVCEVTSKLSLLR